ncbi:peptidylprolyl isomerase fpr3 [Marasmius crinis-equi]|uniref:Peptidylprolyl isomerase fpr3 n=1 Tax=Marasmius crinis-equi TaxID=585013 RepID=A0ABR3FDY9_9AGAR
MVYWSATVHPDSPLKITPERTLTLTNAALGNKVVDFTSRTTLFVHQSGVMGGRGAITSFIVGRIESYSFEVRLTPGVEFVVEVEGKNPISLIGYYENATATTAMPTPGNNKGDDSGKKKKRKDGEDPDSKRRNKRAREESDAEPGPSNKKTRTKRVREESDAEPVPSDKKAHLGA